MYMYLCFLLKISVAAEVMSKKVHKLKECVLKVKFSDKANTTTVSDDTLEVRNFPSSVSEEYLQYYFDSPKSGGCANAVKEITLVKPGLAKVLFSSPKSESSSTRPANFATISYSCIILTLRSPTWI